MHWETMKRCLETVDAVYEQFPENAGPIPARGVGQRLNFFDSTWHSIILAAFKAAPAKFVILATPQAAVQLLEAAGAVSSCSLLLDPSSRLHKGNQDVCNTHAHIYIYAIYHDIYAKDFLIGRESKRCCCSWSGTQRRGWMRSGGRWRSGRRRRPRRTATCRRRIGRRPASSPRLWTSLSRYPIILTQSSPRR